MRAPYQSASHGSLPRRGSPASRPHTLGHTFAATAATLGYCELTITGLLGHSAGSVTARFAQSLTSPLSPLRPHSHRCGCGPCGARGALDTIKETR
ncbi:hypothetical protein E2977_16490 [Paracoccus yeei]